MKQKGKIILLNGVSSSGKSTIAKMIQNESDKMYFHLKQDDFCMMIAGKFFNADYKATEEICITNMMEHAKLLAQMGRYVIIDTVVFDKNRKWLEVLNKEFASKNAFEIGVTCPLDILIKREHDRGNRTVGLSEKQVKEITYEQCDYVVDTHLKDVVTCARGILEYVSRYDFRQ